MFLVSFIEKFNYEYCITLHTDTNEVKMVRNSHFCYRDGRTSDLNVNYMPELPTKPKEESVSFTLISDGKFTSRHGPKLPSFSLSAPLHTGSCSQQSGTASRQREVASVVAILLLNLILCLL